MARCENKMENRGLRWSKRVRWKIGEIKSKMENRGLRQSSVESKMENRGDTPRHDLGAAPRKWRRDRQKCSHTWLLTVLEDCSRLLIPIMKIWLGKHGAQIQMSLSISWICSLGTQKIVVALLTRKNNMEHSTLFALPKVVKIRNRLKMLCSTTSGVVVLVCCSL